jgi:hypothetical protein
MFDRASKTPGFLRVDAHLRVIVTSVPRAARLLASDTAVSVSNVEL